MKDPNRYHHSFFWINPKHHIWLTRKNWQSLQHSFNQILCFLYLSKIEYCFFFCPFSLHLQMKFPLKNLELYRVKVDGSCPFCSGGQVWADNCQVCAAETDDYRLYCLSQAQSTLIQQSHLYLIYESLSLFLTPSSLYAFSFLLCPLILSVYLWASCDCGSTAVTTFPSLYCQVVKKRWIMKQTCGLSVCTVCSLAADSLLKVPKNF